MSASELSQRSFGDWLRQRRRELDLTRPELARQVGCSPVTLRKLEAEERRPSKQMAERLAEVLRVPAGDRPAFLRFARGDPFAEPGQSKTTNPAQPPLPRHNLPLPLTSFVGREQEMAQVKRLLGTARLVTLTGAGGTGKTRLAVQAATSLLDQDQYADGIWLVELALLTEAELLPAALAAALGLREAPGRPLTAVLNDHLRQRQALLVLDDCEHLVLACAELVDKLLRACPRLTVLATSREVLDIPGEMSVLVPPLATPGLNGPLGVAELAQVASVQLFVDRVANLLPGFELTPAEAPAIARICRQLDGLPLAIEVAAAKAKLLRIDQIAERLGDRFQLLAGGNRTALPKHQTLAALMDWSYELLPEDERGMLRRLAVFAGGWTLEAAEEVIKDEGPSSALELLTQLVNKSMVVVERQPGRETRYHMLETIRQYALAKLAAGGELQAAQRQHGAYYLALAEMNRTAKAAAFFEWSERMDQERDNLRAALAWGQASAADGGLVARLAGELWSYWQHHGYWSEARTWQVAALAWPGIEAPEYDPARARVLAGHGIMLELQGEYTAGQNYLSRSLALFQAQHDLWWVANVLHWLGWGQREQADAEMARLRLVESLALFRQLGDKVWTGRVLNTLGAVEVMQEDSPRALPLLEEGLALNQAVGDSGNAAWSLNYLGHVAQLQGEYERAEQRQAQALALFEALGLNFGVAWARHGLGEAALAEAKAGPAGAQLGQALALFQDLGDRAGMAWCLTGLAGVAGLGGDPERAARLWGAAETLRQAIGARPAPAARATRERLMAAAREQLGETKFEAAWAMGQTMTLEQALALALY